MFNLSGSEIVVILLLALIVLGPEKLPEAMRRAGKTYAEIKKLSSGFQDEVRKGFEEPAREVKKTAAAVKSAARMTTNTVTGKDVVKKAVKSVVTDKPRYNPGTDPAPELPEGSSVAEPLAEPTSNVVDTTAEEVPSAASDAIEPVGVADAVAVAEPAEVVESVEGVEPVEVVEPLDIVEHSESVEPSALTPSEGEPAEPAEADRTA